MENLLCYGTAVTCKNRHCLWIVVVMVLVRVIQRLVCVSDNTRTGPKSLALIRSVQCYKICNSCNVNGYSSVFITILFTNMAIGIANMNMS